MWPRDGSGGGVGRMVWKKCTVFAGFWCTLVEDGSDGPGEKRWRREETGREGSVDGVEQERGGNGLEEVHRFCGFLVHFGRGRVGRAGGEKVAAGRNGARGVCGWGGAGTWREWFGRSAPFLWVFGALWSRTGRTGRGRKGGGGKKRGERGLWMGWSRNVAGMVWKKCTVFVGFWCTLVEDGSDGPGEKRWRREETGREGSVDGVEQERGGAGGAGRRKVALEENGARMASDRREGKI